MAKERTVDVCDKICQELISLPSTDLHAFGITDICIEIVDRNNSGVIMIERIDRLSDEENQRNDEEIQDLLEEKCPTATENFSIRFKACVHDASNATPKKRTRIPKDSAKDEEKQDDTPLCVVCLDNPKTTAFSPCGHRCVCETCATKLQNCPLCGEEVTATLKILD
jgi:hypothetical protein